MFFGLQTFKGAVNIWGESFIDAVRAEFLGSGGDVYSAGSGY